MTLGERLTFILFGLILSGALYWLAFQVMKCLDRAEETLDLADRILWALQERMATRGLRAWLAEDPDPPPAPADDELAEPGSRRARGRLRLRLRLLQHAAAQPDPDPAPEEPETELAGGPPTVPISEAVDTWQQTEIPARIDLDDVDRKLARFTFAGGHRGSPALPPDSDGDD